MGRIHRFGAGIAALTTLLLAGCTAAGSGAPATPAASDTAPEASSSSAATPGPTMVSTVTVDPRLPSAQQLPAGLLATTDASWLVATVIGRADDGDAPTDQLRVVDLISPDGVRYQLPDPGPVTLDQWLPGTPLAIGLVDADPAGQAVVVVDLETGAEVARPDLARLHDAVPGAASLEVTFVGDATSDLLLAVRSNDGGRIERVALDGTVVASQDRALSGLMPGNGQLLASDGVNGPPVLLDLATLGSQPVPASVGTCRPSGWLGAGRWLARCDGGKGLAAWVVVGAEGPWQVPVEPGSFVAGLAAEEGGAVLLGLRSWSGGALVGDTVVRATAGGAAAVDTGQAFAWAGLGTAVVGSAVLPTLGIDQPILALSAPVTAWHPADASTTVLVPTPLRGEVAVLPLRTPGTVDAGGWLELGPDGTVGFQPAD